MTIETELNNLFDGEGFLKPRIVVDWAREHPESEIFKKLEWDDTKAADKYRLDQARLLITVYIRTDEGDRATISLVQDRNPEGGYRRIGPVMSNAEMRAMAVRQALREFKRWQQRYQHLAELAEVFAAADSLVKPPEDAAA